MCVRCVCRLHHWTHSYFPIIKRVFARFLFRGRFNLYHLHFRWQAFLIRIIKIPTVNFVSCYSSFGCRGFNFTQLHSGRGHRRTRNLTLVWPWGYLTSVGARYSGVSVRRGLLSCCKGWGVISHLLVGFSFASSSLVGAAFAPIWNKFRNWGSQKAIFIFNKKIKNKKKN